MKRFIAYQLLSTVLIALLSTCAPATADTGKDQTSVQVDKVFADLQKAGSPGCALGVFRNAQIIYAKGYGLGNGRHSGIVDHFHWQSRLAMTHRTEENNNA